ncbi:MAG: HlyD family efflux transporter periplasmic adaptor subunit [Pirellulaceae bacterium]|jgi:multidrug efflux pump subunit AcrA (membrane-fusion protein)|nr:HlyD family efflux transporter periplasmic adaptor subunit [Pirellulaceae bacterium]
MIHGASNSLESLSVDPELQGGGQDEAWREVESALDELAQLAHEETPVTEFHGRLLERCVGLLAATGGLLWELAPSGQLSVVAQLHPGRSLAGSTEELARHQRIAAAILSAGEPRLIPPAYHDGQIANATPWLLLVCPIAIAGQPRLALEIFQRPDGRASIEQGYLRLVRIACELAEQFHRGHELRRLQAREEETLRLVALLQESHQSLDLTTTAATIAHETRRWLACDRAAVLVCRLPGRPELLAVSGSGTFDKRSEVVRAWQQLAQFVAASGEAVWHPEHEAPTTETHVPEARAPEVAEHIQSILDQSHARGLALVPILAGESSAGEESAPTCIGVLVAEDFAQEFDAPRRSRAVQGAQLVGRALWHALEVDRIPFKGALQPLGRGWLDFRARRAKQVAVAAASLLLLALLLWLIPAELTVTARGRLLPELRQNVYASADGVVVELLKDNGDAVEKGELLAQLESPALDLAWSELLGRRRTVDENLQAAETALLGEGQSTEQAHAWERGQLAARAESLREELRGLDEQLTIVRGQQAALAIRSPIAGRILTWDTRRQLAGRPVNRGDLLFTVAEVAGEWELVLDVPDRQARAVTRAWQRPEPDIGVRYQLGTDPGTVHEAQVTVVAPATQLSDEGEPVLRVVARPETQVSAALRPGSTVFAKLRCGQTSLGGVWLGDLWDAIRAAVVF